MSDRSRPLLIGVALVVAVAAATIFAFRVVDSDPPAKTPTHISEPSTQKPADVRSEVEQAYLRFWDAWATANQTMDPAPLKGTTAGKALSEGKALIQEIRAKKEPVKVMVEHNYEIYFPRDGFASVDDTFVDRSVRIDPTNGLSTGLQANETIRNSYTLKKVGGKWKVVEIIGYRSQSA